MLYRKQKCDMQHVTCCTYMYELIFLGCAFLGITTPYARSGSGYVTPSACAKVSPRINNAWR